MSDQPVDSNPLTPRERAVFACMAVGESNKGIADALGMSEHTAKFHVTSVMRKLRTETRVQAVVRGLQLGLLVLASIEIPVTEAIVTIGSGGKYLKRAEARAAS